MIDFRKKHPMEIIGRVFLLNELKKIPALELTKVIDYDKLYKQFIIEELDENNKVERVIYDWESLLFEATDYQLEQIMLNFVPNMKEEPEPEHKTPLIIPTGNLELPERPNLIL